MNLTEYKTTTLARADVKDIVKFEPIERDRDGNVISQLTESGRHMIKYDVHLMRVVKGITIFDKEFIAVLDKGKDTEEVEFRQPSTAQAAKVEGRLEKYIKKLPYLNVTDVSINTDAKNARFTALKDNGNGTATEVEVYAYLTKAADGTNTEKHVEIMK